MAKCKVTKITPKNPLLQAVLSQRKNGVDVSSKKIETINVKKPRAPHMGIAKNKSIKSRNLWGNWEILIAHNIVRDAVKGKDIKPAVEGSPKVLTVVYSPARGGFMPENRRLIEKTIHNAEKIMDHELKGQ